MQLNREAYAKIEAAAKTGRTDAVKELGAAQVGESLNVFENADVVIMQSRYFSESTKRVWLTMRRAKMRGKNRGGTDYFAQPFALDSDGITNEMLLEQDAHLDERQCAGRKDLGEAMAQEYDANAGPGGRSSEERRAERTGQSLANPPPQSGPRRRPAGPSRRAAAAGPAGGTIGAKMEEMDMPAATTLEGL
jgi:hypothetical protein